MWFGSRNSSEKEHLAFRGLKGSFGGGTNFKILLYRTKKVIIWWSFLLLYFLIALPIYGKEKKTSGNTDNEDKLKQMQLTVQRQTFTEGAEEKIMFL